MTNRERFIACATGKPIDRTPVFFMFGPWGETVARWQSEGVENPGGAWADFDLDRCVGVAGYVNHHFCPGFAHELIERKEDGKLIMRDGFGQIIECIEGHSTIPKIIRSPVETLEDWQKLKTERLNASDPRRFSQNWKEIAENLNAADVPVQIGTYPMGLYGTLRDLVGVEGSLYAFYDEPELVETIMNDLTDYYIELFDIICRDVKVDILHIWEDMSGKQGSLISPEHVRQYMLPNYRRLSDFAKAHDIPVVQVDTDGNCEELIPLFAEAGVNMMLPFEVKAGCDVVEWRKKYPYMSMLGGIDKTKIAEGRQAIEEEIERIKPLFGKTGYFPALDHLIPPETSFEDYKYFTERIIEESRKTTGN